MKSACNSKLRVLAGVGLTLLSISCLPAHAAEPVAQPVSVRVKIFRVGGNIPIFMAIEKGYFARRGITPVLQFTPNSDVLRAELAEGKVDIAHSGVDNAVHMVEVAKQDAVILSGGEGGMNELLVRQEINKLSDMRDRAFVVDAPNTAYALIGRKIFKDAGLVSGQDYKLDPVGGTEARTKALDTPAGAATMLNPPWSIIARDRGAKSLGRTIDLFGPYQATGMYVMRAWAKNNSALVERYLTAFIEGCRAAQDPAQKDLVLAVLKREFKLDQRIAELTYAELMVPGSGLFKDCALDTKGFRNVLALRAEIEGQWGGKAPEIDQFIDLSYFEKALKQTMP
jgi:ABC-type nitrate/sulfonate/bicarbonate transport system substrate-binding protein